MFKTFALTALGVFGAAAAYAGSVAFITPVSPVMVEEQTGSMGGSGLWLIPLLIIALVVIAGSSTTTNPQTSSPPP